MRDVQHGSLYTQRIVTFKYQKGMDLFKEWSLRTLYSLHMYPNLRCLFELFHPNFLPLLLGEDEFNTTMYHRVA
jgi:hypothetical protein